MSKAYKVDRTNGDVALENDSVVTVYESLDDAELNINNIEEGQIIGTNDSTDTEAIEDAIKADLDEYAENLMQSYGQAVGSYLTMEDNSVTPQGYLLADGRDTTGTDDELLTKYPLLYAYLGNSNVLPLEYGLRYNPIEYISTELADKTAADPYIVPYDGTIYVVVSSANGYGRVGANLNGNWINFTRGWGSATGVNAGFTINVKKGDTLYLNGATTGSITTPDASTGLPNDNKWYASAVWKKPVYKYIKAVSGIETGSTEAQEVANAVNTIEAYVSNAEVYSTTEVKTNKIWIDGKPIYRIVITATAGVGPSAWGWAISQADFNSIGIDNVTFAGVVADGLQFMPVGVNKSNGFFPMVGMILTGQRIVLEYTKA